MNKLLIAMTLLCVSVATSAQLSSPQDLLDSLAPTGKLRASLYLGGPTPPIMLSATAETVYYSILVGINESRKTFKSLNGDS